MSDVQRLCPVDLTDIVPELPRLPWVPGGARPGEWAMISWPFPTTLPFARLIQDILARCFPDRRRGMTLLSRLVPGQLIDPHCDHHDSGCRTRVHVPLSTNPGAVFITGGERHQMAVGWAYFIDPTQEHSVYNGGETDRVHLIFNAVRP